MKESEIAEKIRAGWIRLKVIIEVAGFPSEHITKTINLMAAKSTIEIGLIVSVFSFCQSFS